MTEEIIITRRNWFDFYLHLARFHSQLARGCGEENMPELEQLHIAAYQNAKKELCFFSAAIQADEALRLRAGPDTTEVEIIEKPPKEADFDNSVG